MAARSSKGSRGGKASSEARTADEDSEERPMDALEALLEDFFTPTPKDRQAWLALMMIALGGVERTPAAVVKAKKAAEHEDHKGFRFTPAVRTRLLLQFLNKIAQISDFKGKTYRRFLKTCLDVGGMFMCDHPEFRGDVVCELAPAVALAVQEAQGLDGKQLHAKVQDMCLGRKEAAARRQMEDGVRACLARVQAGDAPACVLPDTETDVTLRDDRRLS